MKIVQSTFEVSALIENIYVYHGNLLGPVPQTQITFSLGLDLI